MNVTIVTVIALVVFAGLFIFRELRVRKVSKLEKAVRLLKKQVIGLQQSVNQCASVEALAAFDEKLSHLNELSTPAVLQKMVAQHNKMGLDLIEMRKQLDDQTTKFNRMRNAAALSGIKLEDGIQ